MNDPNRTVVFMTSSGRSPCAQLHLPSGETLFPIETAGPNRFGDGTTDNIVTNIFIVPVQYRRMIEGAGFVYDPYVIPQGTSVEDVPANPTNGTHYYNQVTKQLWLYSSTLKGWITDSGRDGYAYDLYFISKAWLS